MVKVQNKKITEASREFHLKCFEDDPFENKFVCVLSFIKWAK